MDDASVDDGCIVDAPLPDALDFDKLKQEGIDRLQALAGQTWTNFNESDPGVTILDQLCYALTELGYCAQFPIADVLTGADGTIRYDGQFFAPQDILTCSPVTPDDYRRLVHDRLDEVRAVYLEPERNPGGDDFTGRYLTYFSAVGDAQGAGRRIHALLNQHRNLGERFLAPQPLAPLMVTLAGTVHLPSSADAGAVYTQILQLLADYEVPPVVQSGYQELREEGLSADEIFNGPSLRNGWIAGLPAKRSTVSVFELNSLISSLAGVTYVEGLAFEGQGQEIAVPAGQLPVISPGPNFGVQGESPAVAQPVDAVGRDLGRLRARHEAASVESQVDVGPPLPQGSYRDIEEYYSVQNTFPDVYGVGPNSLQSDAPSYRVASSRQLKGYLLVYDQLLANEFAQLAHTGELFSFAPPDPARAGRAGAHWPAHGRFCTTYFSQTLYDVPDVQSLLRGNETFLYQLDPNQPGRQVERQAWKRFLEFPFNEYVHGLREIAETEDEAVQRRDDMLTHLMARHGDDAAEYDAMINGCQWYGGEAKTRVIVKSIWLQNYRLLSYYATKAWDYQAAPRLSAPAAFGPGTLRPPAPAALPVIDGELNQAAVFAAAAVDEDDLRSFSTFELKLAILLGLPAHLRSLSGKLWALLADEGFVRWLGDGGAAGTAYALPNSDISVVRGDDRHQLLDGQQCLMDIGAVSGEPIGENAYRVHAQQLDWLASQRKGFLLVEHILLLPEAAFDPSGYYLAASLVFPAYVTLFQQAAFGNWLDTLAALHWPAHVRMQRVNASCALLKPLIPLFVEWHNLLAWQPQDDAPAPVDPAPMLARLLGIGKEGGDAH